MVKQYAVILTFPQNIADELENLRSKYNVSNYDIVPHVTLKMPFKILKDKTLVIEKLNKIAKETKSFEIEMNGVSNFDNPISSVLYVSLKDNSPVSNLHKKIVFALEDVVINAGEVNFELKNYIPHVTIGESIPNRNIQRVKKELSSYKPFYKIFINSFSLFSAEENLQWKYVQKFNFQS